MFLDLGVLIAAERETSSFCSAGKDARANNVGNSRHSVTLVTSLWGNGETGPLTVVLPLGFLPDSDVDSLRQKFEPEVYFISSGRGSHFMTGDTIVTYYEEVLSPAFARRRTQLAERNKKSYQDTWGLILCDAFTGHHSGSAGADIQRHYI